MQLPHQSLELLKQQILPIISHGNLFDKARTMYCYVRCYVAATTNSPEIKRKPGKKQKNIFTNSIVFSLTQLISNPWFTRLKASTLSIPLQIKDTYIKYINTFFLFFTWFPFYLWTVCGSSNITSDITVHGSSFVKEITTHGLLLQWASTIKIQLGLLVWYKTDIVVIPSNLFSL
jgi:hypothetical protein